MKAAEKDLRLEKLKEVEEKLKSSPQNSLFVWGAAETAAWVIGFIESCSTVRVSACVVDDGYDAGGSIKGRQVLRASEWMHRACAGDYVWIGFADFDRGRKRAASLPAGIEGIYFSYPISEKLQGRVLTYEYYAEHKSQFERAYRLLADEKSRRVFEGFVNACISGDAFQLEKERTPGQYFNDITYNYDVSCFIDCGAYTGDSAAAAAEFYRDSLHKIIAFEPDEQNMQELRKTAEGFRLPKGNCIFINKGTWNQKAVMHFSADGERSSVHGSGGSLIQMDSVDRVLKELGGIRADFIKMDVEGSEKESLAGAYDTIRKDRPVLAVSAYHKIEDIFEIPQIIEEAAGGGYQYYLRYHGRNLCDVVLYAVPEEKSGAERK